jgi:catechol 2,3-dioxygenase-like lactoylglutathione lyase family enzyme
MELAKNCIDVGLFTNRLAEMRAFYGERIGLKLEEILPLGGGLQQHRFALCGSVLKINHSRERLGPRLAAGYCRLAIADSRLPLQPGLADPDGNYVELRPPHRAGVDQIEIAIGVSDEDAFERFYGDALGAERIEPRRFKIGRTVISFAHDLRARKAPVAGSQSAIEAVASMRAVGFRYITIQVRDCDAEHRRLIRLGVSEGSAPITLGAVARICFVRDPDGNWIEISQRASLTGPLPKD